MLKVLGIVIALILPILLAGRAPCAARGKILGVSLPRFTIEPNETIVRIEYHVNGGVIVKIRNIPSCWDLHIRNGEALEAKLDAQALFLSAGIREPSLTYLDNLIFVQEHEPDPLAHMFDLTVKLTVTDARWDKVRYIRFVKDQLILTPRR